MSKVFTKFCTIENYIVYNTKINTSYSLVSQFELSTTIFEEKIFYPVQYI